MVVEELHGKTRLGYRALSQSLDIPYKSLRRWRWRMRHGVPLYHEPGPKKVERVDLFTLEAQVRALSHGKKRTQGTGALYQKYAPVLSRREFLRMVVECRREVVALERQSQNRIQWLVPGVVYALDETEFWEWDREEKAFVLSSLDLASRFVFESRMDFCMAEGEKAAEKLREVFEQYGPPLFLKRDNGKNLNAACVNQVLEEYHVLPLNSPAYYSPYNGGVERSHQDVHAALEQSFRNLPGVQSGELLELYADRGIHGLNHEPRRSLRGKTPCRVFYAENRRKYGLQQRRVIHEWIKEQTAAILGEEPGLGFETAYRIAAEAWLEKQGIIRVHKPKSVTPFSHELGS